MTRMLTIQSWLTMENRLRQLISKRTDDVGVTVDRRRCVRDR